jgi:hypothetical protein
MGGFAVIPVGGNTVHITFAQPYTELPVVTATGLGHATSYKLDNLATTGFDLSITAPATTELRFAWTALYVKDATTTTGNVIGATPTPAPSANHSVAPTSVPVSPAVTPSLAPTAAPSPSPTPLLSPTASPSPSETPSPTPTP